MPLDNCDVLTSKNVDARIVELAKELKVLQDFKREFPGTFVEWDQGVTFIRDSYLVNYVKGLAAKCLDLNSWPLKFIDWEKATEDYLDKIKHKSIRFGDIVYWNVTK